MGQAIVHVSPEMLKMLLRLPNDSEILDVGHTFANPNQTGPKWNIGLYVRHKDIPEGVRHLEIVWGGQPVPGPSPQYEFKCWGIVPEKKR